MVKRQVRDKCVKGESRDAPPRSTPEVVDASTAMYDRGCVRHLTRVTTADVIARLRSERDLATGSAPWTLDFIARADLQFGGTWSEVELSGDDALNVMLPPHAGEPCKGDRVALVTTGGARVADAAIALSRISGDYERLSASCWQRIMDASTTPFSTIIATTAPLDVEEFRGVPEIAGTLYRLDGFHRLIGWAWAERLTSSASIRAFVAG